MDLTKNSLPNVIVINGREFSVYTDFRKWMRLEIQLTHMDRANLIDVSFLFKNEYPLKCNIEDLFLFLCPPSELPRDTGKRNEVIPYDFELDADLIYAGFLGQYGIDLIDIEYLHWHKFLALFKGLNSSTRMREVIGYRCYTEEHDKTKNPYREMKDAWEITRISREEQEELDHFSGLF